MAELVFFYCSFAKRFDLTFDKDTLEFKSFFSFFCRYSTKSLVN